METMYDKYHKVDNIEEVYKNRINNELATKINLKIKPMQIDREYQLYYLPEQKHAEQLAKIYKNDKRLNELNAELPVIARKSFIKDTLIEELYRTNKIEGVRSSRKELYQSMSVGKENKKKVRFSSLINSYDNLLSGELKLPENVGDIRKIYNFIVEDEISKTNKIDGKLFRLSDVEVLKNSGTGKVIHRGIKGEDKIIIAINELLNFISKDSSNIIIKLAIFHYYFGYIHPFYDGNGRTARFITSLYLEKELSSLTAISLSTGISINNKNYFVWFEKTNSFKNYGELNGFITMFLDVLISGQEKSLNKLSEKIKLLDTSCKKIFSNFDDETRKNILFVFAQQKLFGYEHEVVKNELCDFLTTDSKTSKSSVDRELTKLEEEGIIEKTLRRPIKYKIKDDYFLVNEVL